MRQIAMQRNPMITIRTTEVAMTTLPLPALTRLPAFVATVVAALGLLLAAPALLPGPAQAGSGTQLAKVDAKMKAMNTLTGRTFRYAVAGYTIKVEFLAEDRLRWTYLEAPKGEKGKTEEEKLDRRDIHYGIILLSWTEKSGASVIDVFDLQTMTLHANFVMPDGKRFFTKAAMTEIK